MKNRDLKQIYFWPAITGVLACIGLIVALLEDGLLENLSIILLCIPVLIMIYFYCFQGLTQR